MIIVGAIMATRYKSPKKFKELVTQEVKDDVKRRVMEFIEAKRNLDDGEHKKLILYKSQITILTTIPSISERAAERLIDYFSDPNDSKSPIEIMMYSKRAVDFKRVTAIGPERAEVLSDVLGYCKDSI